MLSTHLLLLAQFDVICSYSKAIHSKVNDFHHCQKFPYWQKRPLKVQIIPIPPWVYMGRKWPPSGVDPDIIQIMGKYMNIKLRFLRKIERNIYRMVIMLNLCNLKVKHSKV